MQQDPLRERTPTVYTPTMASTFNPPAGTRRAAAPLFESAKGAAGSGGLRGADMTQQVDDAQHEDHQQDLDADQAMTDVEQALADFEQALADVDDAVIERIQQDLDDERAHSDPADLTSFIGFFESQQAPLVDRRARADAHQDEIDQSQTHRDQRQTLIDEQQLALDSAQLRPRLGDWKHAAAQRGEHARRRAQEALRRADAAEHRAAAL